MAKKKMSFEQALGRIEEIVSEIEEGSVPLEESIDKYGEGMSKSKGNGVDPVVVMKKFGADPLRFAMAFLATESQDVRLPLDFECPYCDAKVEQTKDNRTRPRVKCPKCKEVRQDI